MKENSLNIIISGGGTGGHVFPAIAIANALSTLSDNCKIHFVGAIGKLEMDKVPAAGYEIDGLNISGFRRGQILSNLGFPFKLLGSLIKARKIIKQHRPDIVVGVGGYASGPTLAMAHWMGIPTLIQEQNAFPGVTNRLLSKWVNKICVGATGTERFFPKEKIIWTGNPVRQDLRELGAKRAEAARHFNFQADKPILLVTGGSGGARTLNEGIKQSLKSIADSEIQILWQAGKYYLEAYKTSDVAQLPQVRILDFIDRMDLAYAMADLICCRAGALTIAELCQVGKPAILVPSPNVAEDHQTHNAQVLVKENAGILIPDAQFIETFWENVLQIIRDKEKSLEMAQNAKKMAPGNAAEKIAREIIALADKNRKNA